MEIQHKQHGRGGVFLAIEGDREIGEMSYALQPGGPMEVDHTWVDPSQRGRGLARQLVDAGVAYARASGLRIRPLCSYVVAVFREDASVSDVAWRP